MKVTVIFANAFPFGSWEPYLETEMRFYEEAGRVEIFSLSVRDEQMRERRPITNPNIGVHPVRFRHRTVYALNALTVLFDAEFYREVRTLLRARRLTPSRLVQLLVFLSRAHLEAREIAKLIRQKQLFSADDDVAYYSYRFAYQPYLAHLVSRRTGVAGVRVARAHGGDLYEEVAPNQYIPLRDRIARWVDRVHPVSEHGEDYLRRRVPDLAPKISVSRLGTLDHGIAPLPQSDDEIRILTCSNVVPVKRLDRLVEALASSEGSPRIRWVHYGDGPLKDQLQADADRLLPPHIASEFRGSIANDDLMRIYRHEPFHALVNVSSSEGVPVSMMEACSFGVPVIATDVGGVKEIIEDGVNGILLNSVPAPEEILDAIVSGVAVHRGSGAELRRGARRVWDSRFRADTNYPRFVAEMRGGFDEQGQRR